jgi:hypothetical protein
MCLGWRSNVLHLNPKKLTLLLDKLRGVHLVVAALLLTFGCAWGYFTLSPTSESPNGLRIPGPGDVHFGDALYFSIVTETTLGYGDIRPVGFSRALASCEVLLGLLLAGVLIAKITSLPGREVRLIAHNSCGLWIEFMRARDGKALVSFVTITFNGTTVRYCGDTFFSDGNPAGFFGGALVDIDDDTIRFEYSNRNSSTDYFTDGIASLHFTSDQKTRRYVHFVGTAHDFGIKQTLNWQGTRATDHERAVIQGVDNDLRLQLVRTYAAKVTSVVG